MPRRKPLGWPRYMVPRRLRSGAIAYYWVVPTWAKKKGCTLNNEALGSDYADAKKRCDELLNPQLDAWRKREEIALPTDRAAPGTFDWMVAVYKSSPLYRKLPAKTQKSYDAALRLASQHKLKDGRNFGRLILTNITPGVADRLFDRLKDKPDGGERVRSAILSVTVCKRAWNVARRDKPKIVPWENPFDKMELSYDPKPTRPVTRDELARFVNAADKAGEGSLGTAAMIASLIIGCSERKILSADLAGATIARLMRLMLLASSTTRRANWSIFRYSMKTVPCFGRS